MLVEFLVAFAISSPMFENTGVSRTYQVYDDLIVVVAELDIVNRGDSASDEYVFVLPKRELEHVNVVSATTVKKDITSPDRSLPVKFINGQYIIQMKNKLSPRESIKLFVSYTVGRYFLFLKQTITLNQKIGLYFNTSLAFTSPYPTGEQYLSISGISKNSITKISAHSNLRQTSSGITIGPINKLSLSEDLEIEFTTSRPLPYISRIVSSTMVSHWGVSKQKAFYEVTNAGPKFVGEFNRIDFTQNSPCYLNTIPITPPKGAYAFWANDESGQLQKDLSASDGIVGVPLRGPMLSSWKATFTIGWTIPTSKFVTNSFVFTAPLFPKSIPAAVEDVISEYVLPEGAVIKNVQIPPSVIAEVNQTKQVYNLDYEGRPVVSIHAKKQSTVDSITVTIQYTLDNNENYSKIVYLSLAFSVVFLLIVILRRVDCSIKSKTE